LACVALLEFLNLRGYIVPMGENGIRVTFLAELILFLYSIYFIHKKSLRLDRRILLGMLVLLLWGLLGLGIEIVEPYENPIINHASMSWDGYYLGLAVKEKVMISTGFVTLLYLKFMIFLFEICIVKSVLEADDLAYILSLITRLGQGLVWVGVIEATLKYVIGALDLWERICSIILGGVVALQNRDQISLTGLESEPSHFVLALFYLGLFMLIQNSVLNNYPKLRYYKGWRFFLIFALMLFSGGFSSFWASGMLLLLIILRYFNVSRLSVGFAFKMFFLIGLLFAASDFITEGMQDIFLNETFPYKARFDQLFVSMTDLFIKGDDMPSIFISSTFVRLSSIVSTIRDALERPLYGLGMGVQTSHGAFANLLSDFGAVGIILLLHFINTFRKRRVRLDSVMLFVILFVFGMPFGLRDFPYSIFYGLIFEFTVLYCTPRVLLISGRERGDLCEN
jgi:membrane protein